MYFPTREVFRRIYLGTSYSALSPTYLERYTIGIVVNCSRDVPFHDNRQAMSIRYPNRSKRSMNRYLPIISEAVARAHDSGISTLIHCDTNQIGPTIAAGTLLRLTDMDPHQVVRHINQIKPETFQPKPLYFDSLVAMHRRRS